MDKADGRRGRSMDSGEGAVVAHPPCSEEQAVSRRESVFAVPAGTVASQRTSRGGGGGGDGGGRRAAGGEKARHQGHIGRPDIASGRAQLHEHGGLLQVLQGQAERAQLEGDAGRLVVLKQDGGAPLCGFCRVRPPRKVGFERRRSTALGRERVQRTPRGLLRPWRHARPGGRGGRTAAASVSRGDRRCRRGRGRAGGAESLPAGGAGLHTDRSQRPGPGPA